jgi:hypothetical protein
MLFHANIKFQMRNYIWIDFSNFFLFLKIKFCLFEYEGYFPINYNDHIRMRYHDATLSLKMKESTNSENRNLREYNRLYLK